MTGYENRKECEREQEKEEGDPVSLLLLNSAQVTRVSFK